MGASGPNLIHRHGTEASPADHRSGRPKAWKRRRWVKKRSQRICDQSSSLCLLPTLGIGIAKAASPNVVIIDGDTIAIGREHIRILSIDTPETFHSRCENELVLGLRAKERLRELLDGGDIRIERDGQDRYRRTLANVFAGGIDVGATLLKEGFALPYQPGGAAKQ